MTEMICAELRYGYNLGDFHRSGWAFEAVNDDVEPTTPWWDGDVESFHEQAEEELLKRAGFVQDHDTPGHYDRFQAAKDALGVKFEHTGTRGARTLLVALGTESVAYTSSCTELDPAKMGSENTDQADQALANALRALGITPKQEKPAWLLTCYRG